MPIAAHLFGANKLRRQLKQVGVISNDSMKNSMVVGGRHIKQDAKEDAPLRTGNLRESSYVVNSWGKMPSASNFVMPPEKDLARLKREDRIKLQAARAEIPERGKRNHWGIEIGFTVYYAINIHEGIPTAPKTGKLFFLERSVKKNSTVVRDFIIMNFKAKARML